LDLVSPSLAFSLYADLPTTIFDTFPTRRSSDLYVSAAQALLDVDGEEPNMQAQSSLDALLNQHLLQAWGEGRYQLHSIVTGYARSHFVDGNEQANRQALRTAHAKAAQHYIQYASTFYPPRGERRQYSEVEPLVEAVWQL